MEAIVDYDLLSVQEVRVLAEEAAMAQVALASFSQERLDKIVDEAARKITEYGQELAIMAYKETGCGKWQDQLLEIHFMSKELPQKLRSMRCVGMIARDNELGTAEIGVPRGVIAAICPCTSSVASVIYKTLLAIKSGNAIIFSPHPRAHKTIARTLDILIAEAEHSGLPRGAVSYLHRVTALGTSELLKHGNVSVIFLTGVPGLLDCAAKTGKTVLYGGAGNGLAFVERTANLRQAAKDIICSRSFDNGASAAAEQAVVVDAPVEAKFRQELDRTGAYFMTSEESERIARLLFRENGKLQSRAVGRSAQELAQQVGISLPPEKLLLVAERSSIFAKDPYRRSSLSPVLAYYIEEDWKHACEKCIELLTSERQGSTLVIHSEDETVITQFMLKKPVARVLVNTPASLGGMGITTNLFPAMTLGGGADGLGVISDNISPMNLVYIRKVGYGVRNAQNLFFTEQPKMEKRIQQVREQLSQLDAEKRRFLEKALSRALQISADHHE